MNVLFLAKEPLFYVEYAARLENHGVPFWTAHTTNDFHVMLDRMSFDLVFADYNFMDFSKFDVYKHIKSKGGKFVFLFLNEPNQENNLFVHWEDKITEHCPDLWSKELETLLRLVLNQPFMGESVIESEKVENLILKEESEKQNPFQIQNTVAIIDTSGDYENDEIVLESEQDLFSDTSFQYEEQNTSERKLIEDYLIIKKNYNLSFSDFLLLDLFRRKKNAMVSLYEMAELLGIPPDEKNIKKIYRHIHCIRGYLETGEGGVESISRIKKGFYSLVSLK